MATTTVNVRTQAQDDTTWLRIVQGSLAIAIVPLVILAIVLMFFTTSSAGDFKYAADYWLTAPGLLIALACIGQAVGVHRLQHGADGRLGTVGVWIAGIALAELFVQLAVSLAVGAELRWGPSYPVATLLTFVGLALLAAGSWRTGLLPKWMLGVWPLVVVLGSFASFGPTPLVLAVYFVAFGITLTKRVEKRA